MSDKIQVDYRHTTVFYETDLNAVGATTSLTLRTGLAAVGANDAYIRKYGTPYQITDVVAGTTIAAGAGAAGTVARFRIYSQTTGTLLGTITDTIGVAVVYADGAALAAAEPCYIVLDVTAGGPYTVAAAATITLCTDVDPAGLAVRIPREVVTIGAANAVTLYVANGGSTYYESTLKYGGARHTPVIASARYSYFTISAAFTAITGAGGTVMEVLDSETYVNTARYQNLSVNMVLQASLGQTPTIAYPNGASTQRIPNAEYNNTTAIYVNMLGNNANAGTWQLPKLTLANALAAAAGRTVVVGGLGCTAAQTFTEVVALSRPIDVDYEIIATIDYSAAGTYLVTAGAVNMSIRGCVLRGGGVAGVYDNAQAGFIVRECTITGFMYGAWFGSATPWAAYCDIYSCSYGIRYDGAGITIGGCNIHDCGFYGIVGAGNVGAAAGTISLNLIYSCVRGISLTGSYAAGGSVIQYNTIADCSQYGLYLGFNGAYAVVPAANIITGCGTGVYTGAAGTTITINYHSLDGNTVRINGVPAGPGFGIIETNNIAGDPLMVDEPNRIFGLRPGSPCRHIALAGINAGCERNLIWFAGNSTRIDGFILDGGGQGMTCVSATATRTSNIVRWCTIRNFLGTAVDAYATAAENWTVNNNRVESCGTAVDVWHDGVVVREMLIVDPYWYGIYGISSGGASVTHVTAIGGQHGIYLSAAAGGWNIRNCILVNQSVYSAYSAVPQSLFFCDYEILGGLMVDGGGCLVVDPLFIDPESNWKLKSIEGGYPIGSLCIDAADDGYDMGCYLVARGVTDESWDSYTFAFEGLECDEALKAKGQEDFETGRGATSLAVKGHKRSFQLSWPTSHGMTDDFREALELLSTLATSDDQDVTEEQSVIRLHRWPITPMHAETAVLFDPVTWTGFVAAGIGHRRNAFRGYDLTCQWYPITGSVLDNATATLTDAGAAWAIGQWAGYWIRQAYTDSCGATGYNYFRILDNDATILTLSDPYGRIVTDAAFDCAIESDHKIIGNDDLYYYLEEDSRLLSLTRPAFIDAIRCRLSDTGIVVRGQMGWVNDLPTNRVPNRLDLEEC